MRSKSVKLSNPIELKEEVFRDACKESNIDLDNIEFDRDKVNKKVIINEITISSIKAKHLKLLPKELLSGNEDDKNNIGIGELLPIITAISNVPSIVIDELEIDDLTVVSETMQHFLSASPEIGEKSSGE